MISNTTAIDDAGPRFGASPSARRSGGTGSVTFVIGAAGCGKSAYAARALSGTDGAIVRATREWSDADVARRRLLEAADGSHGTLAIDDAHHLLGGDAEAVLEAFVAASGLDRLLVISRRPPSFSIPRDRVVLAPDLALRLPDVADMFHAVGRHRIGLEAASRIRRETAGWAQPTRELAASAGDVVNDESIENRLTDALAGDAAAGWLEEVLCGLPSELVDALGATAAMPRLDLARATGMLGRTGAVTLIGALDRGVVMHGRSTGGRRVLPPILRRHLLRGMEPGARAASAAAACRVLMDEGFVGEAADALAAGRAWTELEALLRGEDAPVSAALWPEAVPPTVVRRSPGIAAAIERAHGDDRVRSPERFAVVAPHVATSHEPPPPLHAALARARRGNLTGAVPLLRRIVRTSLAVDDRCAAQLALLVIRAPLASDEETFEGLLAVERQAVDHGFGGIGRIARGAIAVLTTHPLRGTVRQVCDELEQRGDPLGIGIVDAIDVLDRFRHGALETDRAISFAARCERLGLADVATWGRAIAAVGAVGTGDSRAAELWAAVDAATIATNLPGPRALLAAASAIRTPDPVAAARHASAARRAALETGLPRLPVALPRRPRRRARVQDSSNDVRVTVTCFGGFRLQLDGVDADLRLVRPQARMLLRMLALNAGAPLHRELIADLLWADLGNESALHALHVSVSSLRRIVPGSGREGGIVERVGEAYRLGLVGDHDCDLVDFDAHLSEAAIAKARREPATARNRLVTALEIYTGDVLPEDGPAEWAVGARERYRHRASEAASSLAHLHAHFGETHSAVAAARRAVEIDPWLDESWRTLVTMHEQAGDVIAARRAQQGYRSMRATLGV